MYKIVALDSEPKQEFSMTIQGNVRLTLNFEYKENQLGWFFGFEFESESYQNIRLTTSPNILRAYRSWLPFGIACQTLDGLEPVYINDFASGYASVYILTKEEVNSVEGIYYAKNA